MRPTPIISGSSSLRRMHCPGSYVLEAAMPSSIEQSPDAELGTALHAAMEWVLNESRAVEDCVGRQFNRITITEAHVDEKLRPALQAVDELARRYGAHDFWTELNFQFGEGSAAPGEKGTADYVGKPDGPTLIIADFKFGSGILVEARENYQLSFYALGVADKKPELTQGVTKYVFAIIQPKDEGGETLDIWETTPHYLLTFASYVNKAYLRIKDDDRTLKAGKWCRFCTAKALCPEYQKGLQDATSGYIPPPETVSSTQMADLLERAERAESWAKAVKKLGFSMAQQGVDIPGFKLVETLSARKWKDGVETKVVEMLGDKAYKKTLVTAPQAAKLVPPEKREELRNLYERVPTGLTLKRDTDKGDAVRFVPDAGAAAFVANLKGIEKKT